MNVRTVVLVLLALTCAGSATFGVNHFRKQLAAKPVDTVSVLVAASNVSRGTVMSEDFVSTQQWPKEMVPAGAITSVETITDRAVFVPLVKGEPILESKLASKEAGRGLAALIPKGMRAFSIQTPSPAAGVGGFIMPGNRVDVLLTTTSGGRNDPTGGGVTTTLLQNVEVLAVAQKLDAPSTNTVELIDVKIVTLLVTPDHAAKLDLAMNKGKLHLSLRNPEDEINADTRPATLNDLRFRQESAIPSQFAASMGSLIDAVGNALRPSETDVSKKNEPIGRIQVLRGSHRGGPILVQRR